jgi:hypothetical protein
MSTPQSLPTAVETLESKARAHKQAHDTEYHVSVAEHNIRELNDALDGLADRLRELRYYKTVLAEAFGGSVPSAVVDAGRTAEAAVEPTQADLLDNVQGGDVGDPDPDPAPDPDLVGSVRDATTAEVRLTTAVRTQISQVESATRQAKQATDRIDRLIQSGDGNWEGVTEWKEKLRAAEELQSILGTQNPAFDRALENLNRLLTRELEYNGDSAAAFVTQWTRATADWENHQDLQSFDSFQREHGLSDETVDEVRKLSRSKRVTLADVSLQSLEEMKGVDELASAVDLSL